MTVAPSVVAACSNCRSIDTASSGACELLPRICVPDFNVIADVSLTLQNLLTDALSLLLPAPPPVAQVHDLQGSISTSPATLTLFLFDVIEDPSARNRTRGRDVVPPDVIIRKPPLALLLRYLMTPWSPDRLTDHLILGRVMQTLRSEEHTSELQSLAYLVCRLLLE